MFNIHDNHGICGSVVSPARGVHVGSFAPNPCTCAPILCMCCFIVCPIACHSTMYSMFHYTVTASSVTCHVYHYTVYVEQYQVINSTMYYSRFPLALCIHLCSFDNLHPVKQLPRDATDVANMHSKLTYSEKS